MLRPTLIAVIAVALAVAQIGCASSQKPASGSSRTTAPAATSQARLTYEIVRIQDISIGHVKRYKYKVRVSRSASEGEIRSISKQIIAKAPPHNGMAIFYYLPDADIRGPFTAGKAEWWPNGEIGDASQVRTGDYSKHQLQVEAGNFAGIPVPKPKASAGIPVQRRRAIFYDLAAGETDAHTRSIARKYGISEDVVYEIKWEGAISGWPIP